MAKIEGRKKKKTGAAFEQATVAAQKQAESEQKLLDAKATEPSGIVTLEIKSIQNPKFHDRKSYSDTSIEKLALNMKELGQLQPIVCRRLNDGKIERIIGFRRIKASLKNHDTHVKAIILDDISDDVAIRMMLSENIQREDTNIYDQTVGLVEYIAEMMKLSFDDVVKMINRFRNIQSGNTEKDEKDHKRESEVNAILVGFAHVDFTLSGLIGRLKVLNFDERLKEAMRERKLSYSNASILNKLKGHEELDQIIEQVLYNSSSKEETTQLVAQYLPESKKSKPKKEDSPLIKQYKSINVRKINKLDSSKQEEIQTYLDKIEKILVEG
jgi:ParB family transcriptional regulator, chromosome partitioning protein